MTEEREDKGKVISSFTILKCKTEVVETPDGKRHFESDCLDKKARDEFAAIFGEEAVLRINPKVLLEDTPPAALAEPPAPSPTVIPEEAMLTGED